MPDALSFPVFYGFYDSLFGRCLIAITNDAIMYLAFVDASDDVAIVAFKKQFPALQHVCDSALIAEYGAKIFDTGAAQQLPVHFSGTPFQTDVWRALCKIPAGSTVSYEQIAQQIGKPKAVRAVANAIAANVIAYSIPCHRVVRKSGELGGYRWGVERKKEMLCAETVL